MAQEENRVEKAIEHKDKEISDAIIQAYNVDNPEFSFICGGLRKIAVNPEDRRIRKMLLRKGVKYFSSVQILKKLSVALWG